MEGWWTIVVFGAVIPVGMIASLVLRDRLAPSRAGEPGAESRRASRWLPWARPG